MGRLVPLKGFDKLIAAFCTIAERRPTWDLEIWGEGPERPRLEQLQKGCAFQHRIHLPGITTSPHEMLRSADIFVLSSEYEGFPMALCEAMACGLPVISFDCATGPREIISHQQDGILVPPGDVESLAKAMAQLMASPSDRTRLGGQAMRILERFGPETVLKQWDALLSHILDPVGIERRKCFRQTIGNAE